MRYLVIFRVLANRIIPWFLRKPKLLRYVYAMLQPLQKLNNDDVIVTDFDTPNPSMYQHHLMLNKFLACDAGTVKMEKWLNLYWDMPNEGIVINNNNALNVHYLYNTVENKDPVYFFNEWDSGTTYASGEFVHYEGFIWVCNSINTNKQPDIYTVPPYTFGWAIYDEIEYYYQTGESTGKDFTVEVPLAVSLQPGYSTEKITKQVNNFNAAGRTFDIRIV